MIPADDMARLRHGCDNEAELVGLIKQYLRTPGHRAALARLDLSIEDCLNGRYDDVQGVEVARIYADWNALLGFRAFGG